MNEIRRPERGVFRLAIIQLLIDAFYAFSLTNRRIGPSWAGCWGFRWLLKWCWRLWSHSSSPDEFRSVAKRWNSFQRTKGRGLDWSRRDGDGAARSFSFGFLFFCFFISLFLFRALWNWRMRRVIVDQLSRRRKREKRRKNPVRSCRISALSISSSRIKRSKDQNRLLHRLGYLIERHQTFYFYSSFVLFI